MKYFTKSQVADRLRVNARTVGRWLQKGTLRGCKLGKGRTALWRVPEQELDKFINKFANKPIKTKHEKRS